MGEKPGLCFPSQLGTECDLGKVMQASPSAFNESERRINRWRKEKKRHTQKAPAFEILYTFVLKNWFCQ